VSETASVTAQALYSLRGVKYEMLNRSVLSRDRRRLQKMHKCKNATCSSRPFQTWAAVTRKAQLPMANSWVRLTISDENELKRRSEVCDLILRRWSKLLREKHVPTICLTGN